MSKTNFGKHKEILARSLFRGNMVAIPMVLAVLFLVFAFAGNDVFKPVATLIASSTLQPRTAIIWSFSTYVLAGFLVVLFQAELSVVLPQQGWWEKIIPMLGVKSVVLFLSAGGLLIYYNKRKIAISTMSLLMSGTLGVEIFTARSLSGVLLRLQQDYRSILLSVVFVIALVLILYPLFTILRSLLKVKKQSFLFSGTRPVMAVSTSVNRNEAIIAYQTTLANEDGVLEPVEFRDSYYGKVLGVSAREVIDILHILFAGLLGSFHALFFIYVFSNFIFQITSGPYIVCVFLVLLMIGLGGWSRSDKIKNNLIFNIASLSTGQSFVSLVAVLFTYYVGLVYGVNISLTFSVVGAFFAIGILTKSLSLKKFSLLIFSWVAVLPAMAALVVVGLIFFEELKSLM